MRVNPAWCPDFLQPPADQSAEGWEFFGEGLGDPVACANGCGETEEGCYHLETDTWLCLPCFRAQHARKWWRLAQLKKWWAD